MEHNKNMNRWLLLPVVLLLTALVFLPGTVFADPATAVTVDPASQNVGTGATFTVGIHVVPDTAIAGMQFSLSFDPSLLTANSVVEGNLLSQGGASTFFMAGTINNVAGTITGVAGAITTPGQTVSSPGTFATISFTAKTTAGTSALNLSNVIVADINAVPVAITVTGGQVVVGGAPPTTYTITFATDPTSTGSITFDSVSYSNGNTVNKSANTYNIVAVPGTGYNFSSWQTTGGGLSVAVPTSASTTCTVSGNGTLRMVQTATPPTTYTITFATDPTSTGSITFDSVSYSNGNTVNKSANTYNIVAVPGTGYNFASWQTTGGGLSVAVPTSASTTCTVSGNGTLRMVQTAVPPTTYTITFATDPTSTGSITFDSVSYSNGNTVNKSAATYNIVAVPGGGYYFGSWQTTGGLSVASASSASTTCTVSGNGTLKMVQTQTPPVEYAVSFDTDPEATGTITFAAVTYSDGNTVNKAANTYAITAHPASGYSFAGWQTTGSLSVASANSASTTCTVSGAGTLRMVQTETPPVGGTAYPPNKLLMLLPWIAIGAAIIVATSLLVQRRRSAAR
jgi:hypothetical protein